MDRMQRIIVTNAKGGCGKSTIATNLAACLAKVGNVSLFDYDPQASSITARRSRAAGSIDELLFSLIFLGDDRNIVATYVDGRAVGGPGTR